MNASGRTLVILSNATTEILQSGVQNSGLAGQFRDLISTDRVQSYKPDPRAYQLGVDSLQLDRRQVLFVASAGWDAAGAKWFGYPTFWNARQSTPMEQLDVKPDASEITMRAENEISLGGETAQSVAKLLDWLEDLDDVQSVYSNADLPAEAYA